MVIKRYTECLEGGARTLSRKTKMEDIYRMQEFTELEIYRRMSEARNRKYVLKKLEEVDACY